MITINLPDNTPSGVYEIIPQVIELPHDPVPTPAPRWPIGKGLYIWVLKNCRGGSVSGIVDACLELKVAWVTIKVNNGPNNYNTDAKLDSIILALKTAGIKVWGWGYEFAILPTNEAKKAAERIKTLGLEGYMIDIESEYKNKPNESTAFCDTLRAETDAPLGLASYRYPNMHGEIAWKTFTDICDFHNPQVYWMGTALPQQPSAQLRKSVIQLKAVRDIPVIPIGVASPNDNRTWFPTVAQINDFARACWEDQLPGYSYWSFSHADAVPAWRDAIAAQTWG